MMPKLKSTNFEGMELIRPLYFVKENDIISWKNYCKLEFLDCACTITEKKLGKRKEIKALSYQLTDMYEHADTNILNSMFHVNPNTTFTDKS